MEVGSMQNHDFYQDLNLRTMKKEAIDERKQELLQFTLPVIFLSGLLLLLFTPVFSQSIISISTGLGLYGLILWVWVVRKINYSLAAWSVIGGIICAILVLVELAGSPAPITLLAIPASLAMLIIGTLGSIFTAGFCTLLVLFFLPSATNIFQGITIFLIWSSVGLVYLAWHAMQDIYQWALSSYYENRRLLDQARNNQLLLGQTMSDLQDANLQLTRLNKLTQNLQHAAEEAKIAKESFVASVSHELRTPLNMILGFGEMILKSPASYGRKLPTALLADLSVIIRNSQHLSSLIDDILDLSQIEAGQMSILREYTPYNEIIEAAVTSVKPLYVSKNLSLQTEIQDIPPIFCDRTRIREVLINLLSNAGRFTDTGGVRMKVYRKDKEVITSIIDTGPGISEENQRKLFKPFQQLDISFRRRFGGTGLGLSISKSLIDLHNGKIWVESVSGEGATFSFSLPIDPLAIPESGALRWMQTTQMLKERTRKSLATPSRLFPRYVILESGHTLHRLISRQISDVELAPVSSIDEAVTELGRVPSQALLVNMIANQESLAKLKVSALPANIPVIACSLPDLIDGDSSLGVASYLVKPITPETLVSAIEKMPEPPKTILMIDDEPEVTRLYWRMLAFTKQNYRILTAGDGQQGLNILKEERPDLIFLDLVMPGMDGFQFLALKNQDAAVRDIPVIVITASDPTGHPIVSDSITITQQGGLSTSQIISCIKMVSQTPGEAAKTTHLESAESLLE
jgi:signal transduction histidine kinase/CheY-like chemotaxis protein